MFTIQSISKQFVALLILPFFGIVSVSDTGQCLSNEFIKLTAPDGGEDDRYGSAVLIKGDIAVIGADNDDNYGLSSTGSAYVLRFDGTEWITETKLIASDADAADHFGISLAVADDIIFIGAPIRDHSKGAVYVFQFDGKNWVEEDILMPSDPNAGDRFGISISLVEDVLVVGADGDDQYEGAAYVFRFDGSSWTEEAKLTPADFAEGDTFGFPVSLSGNAVLIGARNDDDNGTYSGSAYIFRYDGANWNEEQKLTASDGEQGDYFGGSGSLSGNVAIIGASDHDDDKGAAYIFRFDGHAWYEETEIQASDTAENDSFGAHVSLSGDLAMIGAYRDDDGANNAGSAYVFQFDGKDWVETVKFTASDGDNGDLFGIKVSINNGRALVGAMWEDHPESRMGAAYVYHGLSDCNNNGEIDICDITNGESKDDNGNGIPDECEINDLVLDLDIKPGSCPNPLNRKSHGMMPAAILGTDEVDTSQIDVSSVILSRTDGIGGSVAPNEGPPGPHSVLEDVGTPFNEELCDCHDLDGDGKIDLSMHFRTQDVVEALELDDLSPGSFVELTVSGILLDKTPFTAYDCIRLVPMGDMDEDGTVSTSDLIIMLSNWGPCAECIDCPADLDGNCAIDISDLLILLANWSKITQFNFIDM